MKRKCGFINSFHFKMTGFSSHLRHFYTGLTWLAPVEFSIMPDTTKVLLAACLEFLLKVWNCFWANNILFFFFFFFSPLVWNKMFSLQENLMPHWSRMFKHQNDLTFHIQILNFHGKQSFQLPLLIAMLVTVHIFLDLIQTFKGARSPLHTHEHITASWNTV